MSTGVSRSEKRKEKKKKKEKGRTPAAFSSSFLFRFCSFLRAFLASFDNLTFFLGTSSSCSSGSTSISSPFLFLLFFFGDTGGGEFSIRGNIENPAESFRGESSIFTPASSSSSSSDPSSSSSSRAIASRTFRIASAFLEGGSPVSKNLRRSSTWSRRASPNLAEGFSIMKGRGLFRDTRTTPNRGCSEARAYLRSSQYERLLRTCWPRTVRFDPCVSDQPAR